MPKFLPSSEGIQKMGSGWEKLHTQIEHTYMPFFIFLFTMCNEIKWLRAYCTKEIQAQYPNKKPEELWAGLISASGC